MRKRPPETRGAVYFVEDAPDGGLVFKPVYWNITVEEFLRVYAQEFTGTVLRIDNRWLNRPVFRRIEEVYSDKPSRLIGIFVFSGFPQKTVERVVREILGKPVVFLSGKASDSSTQS